MKESSERWLDVGVLRLKPECKAEVVIEVEVAVEVVVKAVVEGEGEGEGEGVVEGGRRCFPTAYPPERFS